MGTRREKEAKETKPRATLLGFIYVIAVVVIAFLLAGYVMTKVDLYKTLGLSGITVPLINVSGGDIPKWALQLIVTILFFFILQPPGIILLDLFNRFTKTEDLDKPDQTLRW